MVVVEVVAEKIHRDPQNLNFVTLFLAVNLSGVDFAVTYKFLDQFSSLAFRKKKSHY